MGRKVNPVRCCKKSEMSGSLGWRCVFWGWGCWVAVQPVLGDWRLKELGSETSQNRHEQVKQQINLEINTYIGDEVDL